MVHGDVLLLQVDQQAWGKAVRHHLPVVAHPLDVVAQLDLGSQGTQHHSFHVSDGESIGPEVAEHLVIQELLLNRVC